MWELFHRISERSSSKVRTYVVDHGLEGTVRFRNLAYEEVEHDFKAHGGVDAPALWDGERLISGADTIIARLVAHGDVGRGG